MGIDEGVGRLGGLEGPEELGPYQIYYTLPIIVAHILLSIIEFV